MMNDLWRFAMKKLLLLIIVGFAFILIGCNTDSQTSGTNTLALLSDYGPSTLTVHATYNGTAVTGVPDVDDGSGKIFVYLFKTDELGLTSRTWTYSGSTAAAVTVGVEATITIDHIKDGEYYVLAFYDYKLGGNDDNQTDRYVLYAGAGLTGFTSVAVPYTVSGDTLLDGINFGNTYKLQAQSKFMLPATLTVNATYNGTEYTSGSGSPSGRLFVYLYDTLGADTRTPTPVFSGSTVAAATTGVLTPIILTNVAAGTYYAVVGYDFNEEAGHLDSVGDRYLLYNNKQYASLADTITISDGGSATWNGATFGDSYTLQANGAYMTPSSPVTLTVNATYTGAVTPDASATGKIYVYLYDALGKGTRLPDDPNYSGATLIAGATGTITVNGIVPGDYYLVTFYDNSYSASRIDSPGDKYLLSGGTQYPTSAVTVSLSSNTSTNISVGDDYDFKTNVVGDTLFMQTGSLTVTATYTGTAGTGTDTDANFIYVYLFDYMNASTATSGGTRDPYPIYTGSTGSAVTVGNPGTISINNILPGSYCMVVFYNFNATGAASPDNKNDRYVIYNGYEFPASGITPVVVTAGSNSVSGISFGNSYQLNSGGAFN
jgi:hypothetical protein